VRRKTRFVGLFYKVDQLSGFIQPFPAVENPSLFSFRLFFISDSLVLSGELSLNILSKRSLIVYSLTIIWPFHPKQCPRITGCTHPEVKLNALDKMSKTARDKPDPTTGSRCSWGMTFASYTPSLEANGPSAACAPPT
jgi:hypothetical protein